MTLHNCVTALVDCQHKSPIQDGPRMTISATAQLALSYGKKYDVREAREASSAYYGKRRRAPTRTTPFSVQLSIPLYCSKIRFNAVIEYQIGSDSTATTQMLCSCHVSEVITVAKRISPGDACTYSLCGFCCTSASKCCNWWQVVTHSVPRTSPHDLQSQSRKLLLL